MQKLPYPKNIYTIKITQPYKFGNETYSPHYTIGYLTSNLESPNTYPRSDNDDDKRV